MTEVFVGDDLLELAKAKELASVMGGAWHANEEDWDADSDSEQRSPVPSSTSKVSLSACASCGVLVLSSRVPQGGRACGRQRRRPRDFRPRSNAEKMCAVRSIERHSS